MECSPESPDHLQRSYASRHNLTNLATRQQSLDFIQQRRPVIRKIACDYIFEGTSELNRDRSRWRGREKWQQRRLQRVAVRLWNRHLIRTRAGGVDKIRSVYAILEVNYASLTRSTDRDSVLGNLQETRVKHVQFNVIIPDDLQQGSQHALLRADLGDKTCSEGGKVGKRVVWYLADLQLATLLNIGIGVVGRGE